MDRSVCSPGFRRDRFGNQRFLEHGEFVKNLATFDRDDHTQPHCSKMKAMSVASAKIRSEPKFEDNLSPCTTPPGPIQFDLTERPGEASHRARKS